MPSRTVALAACLAAVVASPAASGDEGEEEGGPPTITVSGTGTVAAAPDLAEINVGVVTQAPTARDALRANTEAMAAMQATLKQRGVAAKDVQTTTIGVQPQFSQPNRDPTRAPEEFIPRVVGYRVINTVQIVARDLTKLGTLLDAVVQAGANQMNGIAFRVDAPEKLLDEARKRAMADARRKAELLAGEGRMVLGPPIRILEIGGVASPQPMRWAMGLEFKRAAAPVPVAAGEQELAVTVQVVYRIEAAK